MLKGFIWLGLLGGALLLGAGCYLSGNHDQTLEGVEVDPGRGGSAKLAGSESAEVETVRAEPKELPDFVHKGVEWLVEAQHPNGGWGAGSHTAQHVRDPLAVQTDPATTAFAASTLLRVGHTPVAGRHKAVMLRATEYLCGVVEESDPKGPKVTDLTGTQPQSKLGPLVDTSMTLQYLSRVLPRLPEGSELHERVDQAVDKCLAKLESSQQENGSWGGGGWASVLQSSLGCGALEYAQAAGKRVTGEKLANARNYQKDNYDADTGRARADAAAGVELYAFAGSQKAAAAQSKAAVDLLNSAKSEGRVPQSAEINPENLRVAGLDEAQAMEFSMAYSQNVAQTARLNDSTLLAGFGSNGGEEFLSYLFTSESLILHGGEPWTEWNEKMLARLAKVQGDDGSWSGHHCITSPAFCTAAVVQCLTVDRDLELLETISAQAVAKK